MRTGNCESEQHDIFNFNFHEFLVTLHPARAVTNGSLGHAPKKVQHLSGREIGVNIKYLGNPFCTNEKLSGFELGGIMTWPSTNFFRYRCTFIGAYPID